MKKGMGHSMLMLCLMGLMLLAWCVPASAQQPAPPQQQKPALSPEQEAHLHTYIQCVQKSLAGDVSLPDEFSMFYARVSENCKELETEYGKLAEKQDDQASEAKFNNNVAAARVFENNARVYRDFAAACKDIQAAYEAHDTQKMAVAMKQFLGIEKFLIGKRMEILGRKWLTWQECSRLCPRQQIQRMQNPYKKESSPQSARPRRRRKPVARPGAPK